MVFYVLVLNKMEQLQQINLKDYLNIYVEKLNYCESQKMIKDGYTRIDVFFNLDGSLI